MMMDTTLNNSISALADGELGYAEGSRAVDQLLGDSESRGSLQRYQLIGACMRGEATTVNTASLFDRIHQQLEQEPTVIAPTALPAGRSGKRPHQGKSRIVAFAAAASVAALMVLSVVRFQGPQQALQIAAQQPESEPVALPRQLVESIAASGTDVASEAEVDRYLMGHQIYSSGAINPGFAATMVSY